MRIGIFSGISEDYDEYSLDSNQIIKDSWNFGEIL